MSDPNRTSDANVAEDHTADAQPAGKPLPPGPPAADDIDFKRKRDRQQPGFTGVPGAGPNPTAVPDQGGSHR